MNGWARWNGKYENFHVVHFIVAILCRGQMQICIHSKCANIIQNLCLAEKRQTTAQIFFYLRNASKFLSLSWFLANAQTRQWQMANVAGISYITRVKEWKCLNAPYFILAKVTHIYVLCDRMVRIRVFTYNHNMNAYSLGKRRNIYKRNTLSCRLSQCWFFLFHTKHVVVVFFFRSFPFFFFFLCV